MAQVNLEIVLDARQAAAFHALHEPLLKNQVENQNRQDAQERRRHQHRFVEDDALNVVGLNHGVLLLVQLRVKVRQAVGQHLQPDRVEVDPRLEVVVPVPDDGEHRAY